MTAIDDLPTEQLPVTPATTLRAVAPEDGPTVDDAPGSPGWLRPVGTALLAMALLLVWCVLYLYVLSDFSYARAQKSLHTRLRSELAAETAPVAAPVAPGAPLAVLDAPVAGLRGVVVVQGSSAAQLDDGPGHLSSTALPGQSGISVVLGRSLSHGAPFADLGALGRGDVVTVTTQQGRFRYVVVDNRVGGGVAKVSARTRAVLTLVTSAGSGSFASSAPDRVRYVDAVLTGTPRAASGTPDRPRPSEFPMRGDHSFATLATLVFALQLLGVGLAGVVWARRRWHPALTALVGVPAVLASLWFATETASRLLPNLV